MRTTGKSAISYSFPARVRRSKTRKLILDEVHRLQNPSEILKIAADHYPSVRILAIGSSSLGASARFRDTLAGRKQELWLTPMISDDLGYFNAPSPEHRLVRGGLPPFFMAKSIAEREYPEWLDAYWAKDILLFFYELLNVTPPKARDAAKAIVEEEKRHVQLLSDRRKRFAAGV